MNVIEFIEDYVMLQADGGPRGILLDDTRMKMVQSLDQQKVIGRYPRCFGKTTSLMGYTLYQLISKKRNVIRYTGSNHFSSMFFLQSLAYAYNHLPDGLRKGTATETADFFEVGDNRVVVAGAGWRYEMEGSRYNLKIMDDVRPSTPYDFQTWFHGDDRIVIVGTFEKDSIVGKKWQEAMENSWTWTAIPTQEEQWKVDTVLSLCNPKLSQGY